MKKITILTSIFITFLAFSNSTRAALIDKGHGLIYDTELNITWMQEAGDGRMRTWAEANAWVENLTLSLTDKSNPITGWRLPSANPQNGNFFRTNASSGELAHLYFSSLGNRAWYDEEGNPQSGQTGLINSGPFLDIQNYAYWTGEDAGEYISQPMAWAFNFSSGYQMQYIQTIKYHVWAVHDGNVSAVPESSPTALAITGTLLLLACGVFAKKHHQNY